MRISQARSLRNTPAFGLAFLAKSETIWAVETFTHDSGVMNEPQRSLQSLLQGALAPHVQQASWQPSVDIYRAGAAWLVKFDLAGVRKEDIEVTLDTSKLIVRGVRRDLTILEGQQAYSMEIEYNQFERTVELPINVETSRFASDYRDGMFLVSITPAAKTK